MILTHKVNSQNLSFYTAEDQGDRIRQVCAHSLLSEMKFHGEHLLEGGGLFIGSEYLVTLALSYFALIIFLKNLTIKQLSYDYKCLG